MFRRSLCIKVPKRQGEKALNLADRLKIVNNSLEVHRDEGFVYIPILNETHGDALEILKEQVAGLEIFANVFPERKKRAKSLADLLGGKLPQNLLAGLPHSADFVGDIAIVELAPELEEYKIVIGEAILKTNRNVRTVLAKAGAVSGTYRLRKFNVIAGQSKTETIHKEYGCQLFVDVAKAYFSPRLSYEHHRVASLVTEGETVVDLFAGVGPFAIPIAKTCRNVRVNAVDVNPDAVEYLKRNVRLNRVDGKIHAFLGDARQIVDEQLLSIADRVIMNLPEKALTFVDVACKALKPSGGVVHFYGFVSASVSLEALKLLLVETVQKHGRTVEACIFSRIVRETAPHEGQAVFDVLIC